MCALKLLNIFESALLTENRIDDAKNIATELGLGMELPSIVILSTSINPNHKYLNWLVRNYTDFAKNGAEDVEEILTFFDRNNAKFKKRDINQYTSYNELEDAVLKISNQKRREIEIVPGTRVIFDDDAFVVLVPETRAASCGYGLGTTWCTANRTDETHYRQYRNEGELYYIISRTKPTNDPTYKMAIRLVFDDGTKFPPVSAIAEVRDAKNKMITADVLNANSSPGVTKVIMDDFNIKWDLWWSEMGEELKLKKEEAIKQAEYERLKFER